MRRNRNEWDSPLSLPMSEEAAGLDGVGGGGLKTLKRAWASVLAGTPWIRSKAIAAECTEDIYEPSEVCTLSQPMTLQLSYGLP